MVVKDPSSAANFSKVVIRHFRLKWIVSFEAKKIFGMASYEAEFLSDSNEIVLDGLGLSIQHVDSENDCTFAIQNNEIFGQRIVIKFEPLFTAGEKIHFTIRYSTSDKAQALQFVDSKLTSDKKAPFLYSQCQSIYARSLLPCMDTPNVKQTYEAEVTVPSDVVCLMSALNLGTEPGQQSETVTFKFAQSVPIPSYLLAIVVGALERREISSRCAIWAEPSKVDAACWEFEDTERMLTTAEELISEYAWKRYDMVLLPPFFSYGGMENPMLTFLTPTLLVGDRSMCHVIAHEITHSWFGNLVTNANWEYFWLNEGFTKFVENKILGRLHGESYRQLQNLCDWENDLKFTVYNTYSPTNEKTKLIPNLIGRSPEEFFSLIPYMKGSAFLLFLEQKLGGPEVFEEFLRAYVKKFAPKSIGIDDFLHFLWEYFNDKQDVLNEIEIDKWLYDPGMPPDTPIFDRTLAIKCDNLAAKWIKGTIEELSGCDSREFVNMTPLEHLNFFNILDQEKEHQLSPEKIELMDQKYAMGNLKNCDIVCKWILLGLRCDYSPIIPTALKFVTDFGRLKYLKPIYSRLFQNETTREAALKTFEKNADSMHPISYDKIKSLIKL